MSIKSNWPSSCGLLAIVTACLLFTGCGFSIQIKEPTEPFSVFQRSEAFYLRQPLLNAIHLNLEMIEEDSLSFRGSAEMISQKLSKVLNQSGIVRDVRLGGPQFGIRNPTLNAVAQVKIDRHPWASYFKSLLGFILWPLLPFIDVEYDCTLTADVLLVDTLQPARTRVSSEMTVTRKMFAEDGMIQNTFPLLAEDLSLKIALELKRHPDWLRPASPTGTP